jgi:hypothetical protein
MKQFFKRHSFYAVTFILLISTIFFCCKKPEKLSEPQTRSGHRAALLSADRLR